MLDKINADLKEAMIARDELRKTTLQGLKSTLKYAEIDNKEELSDEQIVKALQKEAKKRKESIELFEKGGNQKMADQEKQELEIIEGYLPEMASEADITAQVEKVIADTGADSMQDMGKVIGMVSKHFEGNADGGTIAGIVKGKLQ